MSIDIPMADDAVRKVMTVYRLCRDLGFNEGNVYACLDAGDVTKVSRATARRIMEQVS